MTTKKHKHRETMRATTMISRTATPMDRFLIIAELLDTMGSVDIATGSVDTVGSVMMVGLLDMVGSVIVVAAVEGASGMVESVLGRDVVGVLGIAIEGVLGTAVDSASCRVVVEGAPGVVVKGASGVVASGVVASEVVVTIVVTGSGVVVSKGKGILVSESKGASGVINGTSVVAAEDASGVAPEGSTVAMTKKKLSINIPPGPQSDRPY
jgi:hypothetical protein